MSRVVGALSKISGSALALVLVIGLETALGVLLKVLGTFIGGWQSHFILQITRNTLNEVRLDMAVRLMGAPQRFYESTEPEGLAGVVVFQRTKADPATVQGAFKLSGGGFMQVIEETDARPLPWQ